MKEMLLRIMFEPFYRGYYAGIINTLMLGVLVYTDSLNSWTLLAWLAGSIILTQILRNGWGD